MSAAAGYLDRCVAEALAQSGGARPEALRILLARARLEPALLQALVAPHLRGIALYHLDRVARRGDAKTGSPPPPLPQRAEPAPPPEGFADDLLAAIEGQGGALFGLEAAPASTPGQTSARHAAALRRLAAGQRRRHP
jgi:hypothetical protein